MNIYADRSMIQKNHFEYLKKKENFIKTIKYSISKINSLNFKFLNRIFILKYILNRKLEF